MAAMAALPRAPLSPPGGGAEDAAGPEGTEGLFVLLGAGLAAASHPLLYVKLLVQVGHEPLPPTIGRNVLGRKVLYLPGFFTYARHIVEVDGKRGLFRGLTPRLISSTLSTITRGSVKKAFPLEDMEHVSNKDDMKTSLRKVVRETSHEMMMQCVSRVVSHPLHVISMRCMVQFVGREVKYSGVFSAIGRIFKEEGILGFFVYWVSPSHPGGCHLPLVLQPPGSLHQHLRSGRQFQPGVGDPELHQVRDGDRCEHADVPVPSRGRSHGSEQLWVACRPPSLCSCLCILDPLLEAPQCSGAAVPWLQPAVPQGARPSRLLPHRLTPRQGELINSDSSRNPKLVSISVYFYFLIQSPWCQN
ncbi:mitochondrial carrier homolog 1 isoform X2 [Poecile atricapillus]|uniref:mitochondrial carrier homolog 1 isoform X2 n=1 Tax=Poecile atricapillus TaxID=48891 RepID=UPI002739B872|nr:mitochondrial carrier homolog 1 isoform X2 [Poecile atricapillus]